MDEYFMKEAIKEAEKAYKDMEIPVGAVIVLDGQIIGRGYNRVETLKNSLAHAEIIALDEASKSLDAWRLIDCTIYVTLEPCAMCSGAIVNSRIKRLVIGTSDPKRGCAGSLINIVNHKGLNHRLQVKTGVLEKECKTILQNFFKRLRKNKKN
ncbi:MAG: tRNA adenosine(34) deaminase TadA [Tissierella sp.]|uniref:tRNA adenosine(34) deaminase TadA n=1 Tax=Tissierella sp. TaxID=41274 RepID=UPI003F9DA671